MRNAVGGLWTLRPLLECDAHGAVPLLLGSRLYVVPQRVADLWVGAGLIGHGQGISHTACVWCVHAAPFMHVLYAAPAAVA